MGVSQVNKILNDVMQMPGVRWQGHPRKTWKQQIIEDIRDVWVITMDMALDHVEEDYTDPL